MKPSAPNLPLVKIACDFIRLCVTFYFIVVIYLMAAEHMAIKDFCRTHRPPTESQNK
ncbi:MAG: hypothetical protein LBU87_03690 [Lactobacillales bacterium]|nr:hypothetical protein [Lactobacillales bacterium]